MAIGFDEYSYARIATNTSASVGDAGMPIALYGYVIKSAGTAGNVSFLNGVSGSATAVFDNTGVINNSVVQPLPAAIVFPKGLYVTTDANVSYAVIIYRQVLTA